MSTVSCAKPDGGDDSDYEMRDPPPIPMVTDSMDVDSRKGPVSRKRTAKKDLRKAPSKFRGSRGKLVGLLDNMPIEIFDMVVGLVDPKTLINLSRSCKQLRKHLLSSETSWRLVRQRCGLPDLEMMNMTERQYIILVFDIRCQKCQVAGASVLNFIARERFCRKCLNAIILPPPKRREELKRFTKACASNLYENILPGGLDAADKVLARGARHNRIDLLDRLETMQPGDMKVLFEECIETSLKMDRDFTKFIAWRAEEEIAKAQEKQKKKDLLI
ncbi:hypothetical protein CYLTODRAFT_491563 [Cylindrobasidium torrendii FP15055 ss-10]|uniref:F-box domain-containing protein n=1 Tax=Cylindrobasidium torrendii FP15055 ss-10 TaxID=1314674 RepID=A0A0D7B6Z3_9AGAR|nr:hypothetical protein CYLTODRAFT_491563 [Cylindrobasidium torrendii FP15055 ss-10]